MILADASGWYDTYLKRHEGSSGHQPEALARKTFPKNSACPKLSFHVIYGRPGPLDPSLEGPGRMKPVQDAEVSQVKFLKNKDPRVRSRAAENLARLGPQAKFAIFPLSQRLRDSDANVRCRAATALGEIGSAAVAELMHALSLPDANIRREAVWALAKMGP